MDYAAFIRRLSRRGLFRIKPGLGRVQGVLQVLDNPQETLKVIHIAGTNGKGSVAASLESVLRQAGFRTGLYTSPHLWDVRERIQINGRPVSVSKFWGVAQRVLEAEARVGFTLTYFEFLTVMAFVSFADEAIDAVLLETGMGGRWDATNVVSQPVLTVITSIGLDHVHWLGPTEAAIAREKAGIIKPGVPLVSGARGSAARVIARKARQRKARLYQIDKDFDAQTSHMDWERCRQTIRYEGLSSAKPQNYCLSLLGRHQTDNAALVLAALEILQKKGWRIGDKAIREGLLETEWPGRFQLWTPVEGPRVLFDGAHNTPALGRMLETIKDSPWQKTPKVFVFSAYRDKDYQSMLNLIVPHADRLIFCTLPGERALPARTMAAAMKSSGRRVEVVADPHEALQTALRSGRKNDLVVVTGSLALVGVLLKDMRFATQDSQEDRSEAIAHV